VEKKPHVSRRDPSWRLSLVVIALIALALRLLYLWELRGSPFFSVLIGDSLQFDTLARRIIAGDWSGSDVFYQAQMYPYFLAAIYAISAFDPFAVRIVQAGLGAASCVLLAIAARRLFDRRTGLVAGVLVAVYPPAIFFDGLIQKSSPDLLLMSLLLVAIAASLDAPKRRWVVLMGISVGALSWNRENARVLFPVIAIWLLGGYRSFSIGQRLRFVAMFIAGSAVVLAPVAIRNARTSGELLMTTSQFGPNFYIGNHDGASGGYESLIPGRGNALYERQDAIRVAEQAAGRQLSASEVSDFWRDRTLADIRRAPLSWVRLLAKKTWLTFAAGEPLDTESLEAYAASSRLLTATRPFTFGVVMALALFGIWLSWDRRRELAILYAIFAALASSVIVFFVFARYRYPLVPVAMLFAAAGVTGILEPHRFRLREWRWPAAAAVALLVLLHIPVATSADQTFANYGAELLRLGRAGEAVPLLRQAVAADPQHVRARLDLALALQRTAQPFAAIEQFRQTVQVDPSSVEAHGGMAMALHQEGRTTEAISAYREALRLKPDAGELTSNLGLALLQGGKPDEAIQVFERAVALQPGNIALHMNLCSALEEVRNGAAAVACFERALSAAQRAGDADSISAIQQGADDAARAARALAAGG
jgi:Tfp pilus assembly protein PilF